MKKFLKGLGVLFFGSGLIVYTIMFFMEAPELRPVFIMMDVIMGFFLFLLLRKKKPKQTSLTRPASHSSASPTPKPKKYSSYIPDPSDNFFVTNYDYLHELEQQAITPQMKDYGDIDSYRLAYEISLGALHTLKDFCYASPEGTRWYESMYHHCFNSRCDDFNFEERIEEGYQDLIENWAVYEQKFRAKKEQADFLLENGPQIRRMIIEIVKAEPGILQKDIYSRFDPAQRKAIISILQALTKEKVLFREPYKNTFKLFLKPPVLRSQL